MLQQYLLMQRKIHLTVKTDGEWWGLCYAVLSCWKSQTVVPSENFPNSVNMFLVMLACLIKWTKYVPLPHASCSGKVLY